VEICVLDRGPGVPRGSEEKVFEKFYRAHDSLGSGIQGSGLGLTIARQIAAPTAAMSPMNPAKAAVAALSCACPPNQRKTPMKTDTNFTNYHGWDLSRRNSCKFVKFVFTIHEN